MARSQDASDFFYVSAFFSRRVLFRGRRVEGHVSGEWISRGHVSAMLAYARDVAGAGGLFYLDNKKFRYVNNAAGESIEAVGHQVMSRAHRQHQAFTRFWDGVRAAGRDGASPAIDPERSEASTGSDGRREAVWGAKNFTCLVTRKVSLTDETKAGFWA